jgi:hypothetical protein
MSEVLAGLRAIFPDDEYPDEPNAESDSVDVTELRQRQLACPPQRFFQEFVAKAAARQQGLPELIAPLHGLCAARVNAVQQQHSRNQPQPDADDAKASFVPDHVIEISDRAFNPRGPKPYQPPPALPPKSVLSAARHQAAASAGAPRPASAVAAPVSAIMSSIAVRTTSTSTSTSSSQSRGSIGAASRSGAAVSKKFSLGLAT